MVTGTHGSQHGSFADPPVESNAVGEAGPSPGSKVVVTMSQERRRCHGNKRARVGPVVAGVDDRRDWANLTPDLVDEIARRALSVDVTEYLLFRAVCMDKHVHIKLEWDERLL
ncbi:hypothetical protein ACP70R_005735 [Stipagrostis hirtigluma subsp. patula]